MFTTHERYQTQGTPDADVAITDDFRICFVTSHNCMPWFLGGASGPSQMLSSPPYVAFDETGWGRSPWMHKKVAAYIQWRFTWRQENADYADLTVQVAL